MTAGAWVMLSLAWGAIISVAAFCIYRTMQNPPRTTPKTENTDIQKERVR